MQDLPSQRAIRRPPSSVHPANPVRDAHDVRIRVRIQMQLVDQANLDDRTNGEEREHHDQAAAAALEGEKYRHHASNQRHIEQREAMVATRRGCLCKNPGEFVARDKGSDADEDHWPAWGRAWRAVPIPVEQRVSRAEDNTGSSESDRHPPACLKKACAIGAYNVNGGPAIDSAA
eukprot:CAMPEP_0183358412 /NCGR_PEP_ID=MMETSP0164_2-20130417/49110_1 /TAXON_ID=221442 /ORGANISM="Coccolithus pelagicus ssp braarudi, Strain PLY182g" /LENGTH=174 /DNA_ID=CAMNT_0025532307 /DNA_START=96 /DNA_END=621 /DNA_ORIENTATION=+